MDSSVAIILVVIFAIAFGIGGVLANRVYPREDGEHWTRAGKRNVVRHAIGWGVLIAGALIILALPSRI